MTKIKLFISLIVLVIFPSASLAQGASETVWEGSYRCGSNETDLTIKLGAFVDGEALGEFVFNRPSGGFSGSYTIIATLDATETKIIGTAQDWIVRPSGATMVGFEGNILDGQITGEIKTQGCTTMEVSFVGPWNDAPQPNTQDNVAAIVVPDDSETGPKAAALRDLQALQNELENMSFDLASLSANNWISLDRDRAVAIYDNSGLAEAEIDDILGPLLQRQREAAIPIALAELEAEANAAGLDLEGYMTFCANRLEELGVVERSEMQATVFEMCDERLAELMQLAGATRINALRDDFLSRQGTLQDLIDTNGYEFSVTLPRTPRRGPFRDAVIAITAQAELAEPQIREALQTAIDNAVGEVRVAFSNSAQSPELAEQAMEMCEAFSNVTSRLAQIAEACRDGRIAIQDQRFQADCDLHWDEIDVPDEIRNGFLHTPTPMDGMQPFTIEKIICQAAAERADLTIEADRGVFSTDYRLVHRMEIGNTDVSFSVRLVEPDGIGNITWTVDDPIMEPGGFDRERVKTSDDLMTCLYRLERCFRAE